MRANLLFRLFVGLAVAALFVLAGRSRGPATATASQGATQPVAAAGDAARR
ncbi:MAG TPA: hypothetical protein VFF02_08235 [Anaeromyxobacteraceae bacterium]|nr:hypothetical protein [Anaeromyxobacteraceae bacterium]